MNFFLVKNYALNKLRILNTSANFLLNLYVIFINNNLAV